MKFYNAKILVTVSIVALTAGCGGGGGSDGGGSGGSSSFTDYNNQIVSLIERNQNLPFSDPATLPTSGTATYRGVMAVESAFVTAAGDMTMNANFGAVANPITGSVSNMINDSNQRYSGSLSIGNSSIDRTADTSTEYTFSASLTGQLGLGGETAIVNGQLEGDFFGADRRAATGEVSGTIGNLSGSDFFSGGFVVER